MELGLAIGFSIAFALTNGFHDAANAIATLVATRGARPGQAVVLAAVFNMLGALLVGTAVADTIAGIVTCRHRSGRGDRLRGPRRDALEPAHLVARPALELRPTRWSAGSSARPSPRRASSAIHGAASTGWKPVGVVGVLIALAVSPLLGLGFGLAFARLDARRRCAGRRAASRADPWGPSGRCRPRSPSATAPTTGRRRWG